MTNEELGELNFQTAKAILKLLGVGGKSTGAIQGLKDACANCDRYGPPEGKRCAGLRLAAETGIKYTPPEWCRDPEIKKARNEK